MSTTTVEAATLDPLGALRQLATPIERCIERHDTPNPAFHGCVDWHSAVHATFALLSISRLTGDPRYRSEAEAAVGGPPELDRAVADVIAEALPEEVPYGMGWALVLATEGRVEGNAQFDSLAAAAIEQLSRYWVALNPTDLLNRASSQEYQNSVWPVICLLLWARASRNAALEGRAANAVATLLSPQAQQVVCGPSGAGTSGFFAPCALLAVLAWLVHADNVSVVVQATSRYGALKPSDLATAHSAGLNFSRAWGLVAASQLDNAAAPPGDFDRLVGYEMSVPETWATNYFEYAHWVAQFGVFALWLKVLPPALLKPAR